MHLANMYRVGYISYSLERIPMTGEKQRFGYEFFSDAVKKCLQVLVKTCNNPAGGGIHFYYRKESNSKNIYLDYRSAAYGNTKKSVTMSATKSNALLLLAALGRWNFVVWKGGKKEEKKEDVCIREWVEVVQTMEVLGCGGGVLKWMQGAVDGEAIQKMKAALQRDSKDWLDWTQRLALIHVVYYN